MLKKNYYLQAVSVCNKGKIREKNEDNLYFAGRTLDENHEGISENCWKTESLSSATQLYGVFDGMGGHSLGEKASYLFAKEAENSDKTKKVQSMDSSLFFQEICSRANDLVCQEMKKVNGRVGTTGSMLLFFRDTVTVCNIGDSPIFRIRDGVIEPIYEEHTERKMNERLYGKEKVKGKKFPLTQHIGIFPEEMIIEPYICQHTLNIGDTYLICSDGLTDMVEKDRISFILEESDDIENAILKMEKEAMKNGGRDNITIILVQVMENQKTEICEKIQNLLKEIKKMLKHR